MPMPMAMPIKNTLAMLRELPLD